MQHVKDTALLVVTCWAAMLAGRLIALVIFFAWPAGLESDTASAVILSALMFLAGLVAGAHLMKHLKWAARFCVLAVPFCLATLAVLVNAMRLTGNGRLLDKVAMIIWAQLELLVFVVALLLGALARKTLSAAASMPNKTMEPTR